MTANAISAGPADASWLGIIDSLSPALDLDSLADSPLSGCNSVALIRWQLSKTRNKKCVSK